MYFGALDTDDYDVYQFQNSVEFGGTDPINSGTHPEIVIDAGGSITDTYSATLTVGTRTVPEPSDLAFVGVGLLMMGIVRQRFGKPSE